MAKGKSLSVVKVIDGYSYDGGHLLPVEAFKSVSNTHTKRYHNCLYLLARLSKTQRNLMDFLCEKMSPDNIIYNSDTLRASFRDFMLPYDPNGGYSDYNTNKNFEWLSHTGLLVRLTKGQYRVNPEYFFRADNNKKRELLIFTISLDIARGSDTVLRVNKKGKYNPKNQGYVKDEEENE